MRFAILGILCCLLTVARSAQSQTVTPIDWARFSTPAPEPFQQDILNFINRSAGYNLNWVESRMASVPTAQTPSGRRYDMVIGNESEIRPLSHIVYSTAALLKTGGYNAALTGFDEATFRNRTIEMIHGAALEHKANAQGVQWGNVWQSALWAAHLAEGAWMLWEELPTATQSLVANMAVYEANRFVNYNVPYWANPNGTFNTPGDTKAEENAWNSRMLSVAVAMMPDHVNSQAWRSKASELLVSSYARPSDLQNSTVLDGKAVSQWIKGYNAYETGFVVNHGFIHNDYHATTGLTIQPFITQSLAQQTVPQTAGFNADIVYNAMATVPVGSLQRPMFRRGALGEYVADQYYPQGTDWSLYRYDIFLEMDAYADYFGHDSGKPYDAAGWAFSRLDRILEMQSRHSDGKLYAPGEFDTWSTREAYALQTVTNLWLLGWLDAQDQVSAQGNWITNLDAGIGNHLLLTVDRATGEVIIRNSANVTDVPLDGYAIRSASGQLNPATWQTLTGRGMGTWLPANPTHTHLGELNISGNITVVPGEQLSLGSIHVPPAPMTFGEDPALDLKFDYTTSTNQILRGKVIYTGVARNVTLLLVVDPLTGHTQLRNETPFTVELEGYLVGSSSGALQPTNGFWNSLFDQNADGGSWIEANPSSSQIAELNMFGATTLAPSTTFELGKLFDTAKPTDLVFRFILDGENEIRFGQVIYESLGLPGDFNDDGFINAADYAVWRDQLGSVYTETHYSVWRSNFGGTAEGLVARTAVPEPANWRFFALAIVTSLVIQVKKAQSVIWFIECRNLAPILLITHKFSTEFEPEVSFGESRQPTPQNRIAGGDHRSCDGDSRRVWPPPGRSGPLSWERGALDRRPGDSKSQFRCP